MEQVYRILRNNMEVGPLTLTELRHQNLQSNDLVWVDGISTAWAYTSEISALSNPASSSNGRRTEQAENAGSKVEQGLETSHVESKDYISKDVRSGYISEEKEFEKRAEDLRKKILGHRPLYLYVPGNKTKKEPKPFVPLVEHEIDIIYHQRKRNEYLPHLMMAGVIFVFLISFWNKTGFSIKRSTIYNSDIAAKQYIHEAPNASTPVDRETPVESSFPVVATQEAEIQEMAMTKSEQKPLKQKPTEEKKVALPGDVLVEKESVDPTNAQPVETKASDVLAAKEPEVVTTDDEAVIKETSNLPGERKGKLGSAIKGLFKRKNKVSVNENESTN